MSDFLASVAYVRWVLPALLAIPVVGALLVWGSGFASARPAAADGDEVASGRVTLPRMIALLVFLAEFIVSLGLWWVPDTGQSWQAAVEVPWIPSWGINFAVGVDGIATMMILLTTSIMVLAVLGSWTSIRKRTHTYYALLLVLTTGMLGVFMSLDLALFYVMWELMLVPMYFIIGIWGGDRRLYASIKFFLFTMIGSLLMLVAIVWIGL